MKSIYYQIINFFQEMSGIWFVTIWLLTLCVALGLLVKFFKIYNGKQKKFEKLSLFIIALVLIAFLVFLTYVRK